jgi:hypothetical protein
MSLRHLTVIVSDGGSDGGGGCGGRDARGDGCAGGLFGWVGGFGLRIGTGFLCDRCRLALASLGFGALESCSSEGGDLSSQVSMSFFVWEGEGEGACAGWLLLRNKKGRRSLSIFDMVSLLVVERVYFVVGVMREVSLRCLCCW